MSTSAACDFSFKTVYDEQVRGLDLKVNSFCIPDAGRYEKIISEVIGARNRANKKPLDYRRLKRYDVLKVNDQTKLILPLNKSADNAVKYYVHNGELFDILCGAHVDTGHGGLHKMHLNLKKKYVNITRPVIQIFLANCKTCSRKRSKRRTDQTGPAAVRPRALREETERGQVDLMNMGSCADDGYDFVLKYQDCATRFVVLRALKTRAADEIARHLIDIFCIFGAPAVLQSDNGAKFLDGVTKQLNESTWPRLEIACGKAHGSPLQYHREQADLQDRLKSWMIDNKSDRWSEGLRFCQYQRNNTPHPAIGQSPFEALFGKKSKSRFIATSSVSPGGGGDYGGDTNNSENLSKHAVPAAEPNNNPWSAGSNAPSAIVDSDPLDCSTSNCCRTAVRKNTYSCAPRPPRIGTGVPRQVKRTELQDITFSKRRSDKKSQT